MHLVTGLKLFLWVWSVGTAYLLLKEDWSPRGADEPEWYKSRQCQVLIDLFWPLLVLAVAIWWLWDSFNEWRKSAVFYSRERRRNPYGLRADDDYPTDVPRKPQHQE